MISVNISEFSRAADYYLKNKCYTKAPRKSKDWYEFWREETRRCEDGFKVGDVAVTGEHYFFMNFTPMKVTPAGVDHNKKGVKKELQFPRFNLLDYNWFWSKHIARWGTTEEHLKSLELHWKPNLEDALVGGKHICCAKTRGCGFSYKGAASGTYNYNFIRKSKSFYFAAKDPYLWGADGIMLKCWDNLEWLNGHTDNWWRKNRMEIDNSSEKKASVRIKTPQGVEVKGYESMIGGVIVDDPQKVRGARGELLIFEEGGSFRNLSKAIAAAKPLVEDDTVVTGQIIVFGTGGQAGEDIQGLEDLFYSPESNNFMRFDNVWDENDIEEFGFFVPCTAYSPKFTDQYGNPIWSESKKEWEDKRELTKKSKGSNALRDYDLLIAERPFTPSECFKRVNSNIFQDALYYVNEQIKNIEHNKDVKQNIKHGTLMDLGKGWEFQIRNNAKPLFKYPHNNADDLDGCLSIYEEPHKDNGVIPYGLYTIIVDPFMLDDAEDKTSLGGIYAIKHNLPGCGEGGKISASHVSRPSTVRELYKRIVALAEYYNATIQSEVAGGGQGLIDYLKDQNKLYLAEFAPDHILQGAELNKNMRNRKFFMNVTDDMKKTGLLYFAEYLIQPRGVTADGRPILNVHLIYDLGLLQEITKFVNDPKKNFDRISCMILAMYMFKEKTHTIEHTKEKSKSNFFKRKLFTNEKQSYNGNLDLSNEIAILNKDWRE